MQNLRGGGILFTIYLPCSVSMKKKHSPNIKIRVISGQIHFCSTPTTKCYPILTPSRTLHLFLIQG